MPARTGSRKLVGLVLTNCSALVLPNGAQTTQASSEESRLVGPFLANRQFFGKSPHPSSAVRLWASKDSCLLLITRLLRRETRVTLHAVLR
ncbi:unnamed protein product [Protopolystoma xenopodis]|uniref:Secreted protein n=1 Tax=Protopolystoma xenopodis TaxID=117903 RepID=A0A3S5A8L7_9PLAT|nr:unnamed protein product [Protopolystoma xenopodis]